MFGRRKRDERVDPPNVPTWLGSGVPAFVAVRPITPEPPDASHIGGTAGWAPGPGTPSPQQQIGAFAGRLLTQFPALITEVQKHSCVEFMQSGWNYPMARPSAGDLGNLTQTQRPANLPGAQRRASQFQDPIGPISARGAYARVVADQVRQSGAAAMSWANALNPLASFAQEGDG
jgi:hypothetical protein